MSEMILDTLNPKHSSPIITKLKLFLIQELVEGEQRTLQ